MATGIARGAKERGKRIAFGDGRQIMWSEWAEPMFRDNPNIARPGDEDDARDLEWVAHYKSRRLYNRLDHTRARWVWNMDFRPIAGEIFFSDDELRFAKAAGSKFIVIEPNLPRQKSTSSNKDWGLPRFRIVAKRLITAGHQVVQFGHGYARMPGVRVIHAAEFRQALAVLSRASLYIGPEGGLHHGAAAVGIPAVVLFGGFIPPQVTGYDTHANLTGGVDACGSLNPCQHCRAAMDAIEVDMVYAAANSYLSKRAAA